MVVAAATARWRPPSSRSSRRRSPWCTAATPLRASKIMQDRAFANEKVAFVWDSEVVDVHGGDQVTGVRLRHLGSGDEHDLATDGLFLAIGHTPNTAFLAGQLEADESGYVVTKPGRTLTSKEGVFACGDVQDHVYRQAVTAAGSGCAAAMDCEKWLQSLGMA
ncbi:MAG: NAD(P)/FAD-dependent oxidoreductase [Myxococcota bacterium]